MNGHNSDRTIDQSTPRADRKYVLGEKILPILPKGRKLTPDGGGDKNYTKLQQKHGKTMTQDLTSGNALARRLNVKTCNER